MKSLRTSTPIQGESVKTYIFQIVIEPDEDEWYAYCPALMAYGASTTGRTLKEAAQHINDVVQLIVQELTEDGVPIPTGPADQVEVLESLKVAITA